MPPEDQDLTPQQALPNGPLYEQQDEPPGMQQVGPQGYHGIQSPKPHHTGYSETPPPIAANNQCFELTSADAVCHNCIYRAQHLKESQEAKQHALWELQVERFMTMKPTGDLEYDEAEDLYKKLFGECKEVGGETKNGVKLEGLKEARDKMKNDQAKSKQAEAITKGDWSTGIDVKAADCRLAYRQRCTDLHREKEYEELERWLRQTWPTPGADLWAVENGDQLCDILEVRGVSEDPRFFNQAFALRQGVWAERKALQTSKHRDTVQTGLRLAECTQKQVDACTTEDEKIASIPHFNQEAVKAFRQIWELWDPENLCDADEGIMTAGQRLGHLYFCQAKYEEARGVLQPLWNGRKGKYLPLSEEIMVIGMDLSRSCFHLLDYLAAKVVFEDIWAVMKLFRREPLDEIIEVGYYLSLTYAQLKDFPMTESTSRWVWEAAKTKFEPGDLRIFRAQYQIGWAMVKQNRYEEAEGILTEAFSGYTASPDPATRRLGKITCGQSLGEAIFKLGGRCSQAFAFLRDAHNERAQPGGTDNFGVLESDHLYGCVLVEHATFQNTSRNELLQNASRILSRIWQARTQANGEIAKLGRPRILEAGRYLILALVWLRDSRNAEITLKEVLTYEGSGSESKSSESLASSRHLGVALMNAGRYEMAEGIFGRLCSAQTPQQTLAGAFEDGCCHVVCLMEARRYPEAERRVEEVASIIERANICDHNPLAGVTLEALRRSIALGKSVPLRKSISLSRTGKKPKK
jgi:tetratricopeptide (TPR) repeat protein